MIDFTLAAYQKYIEAIKAFYPRIIRFVDYFKSEQKAKIFCIIRHDVDRNPINALKMAKLERDLGIKSTYYFRVKSHTFKTEIIKQIASFGHEIGYHYESVSDANGNIDGALADFENNLSKLRKIVPISTVSMHGRPFSPFDNLNLWRNPMNHRLLLDKFSILGEIYIDIDYQDIAYISDTGRNWTSTKSNIKDKVCSKLKLHFETGLELYNHLNSNPNHQMVFSVHPERWTDNIIGYYRSLIFDLIANTYKNIVKLIKKDNEK